MNRLKIGIIFGGSSEEHPVSVKSAREVARNLDTEKYEPFWIGITKDGAWKLCDGPDENWQNGSSRPVILSPDPGVRGLLVLDRGRYETISLDLVLPVLHGRLGEGGAMQGFLELSGIPYAGCDVQSAALCMDKSLAYIVVRSAGIATPNFWVVAAGEVIDPGLLTYPVFVKPARSGSSFGVSKVSGKDELPDAMEIARQFDSKVLIEEAVVGSEVGCAILGNGTDLIAGEVDRVALSHGFFRIHQEIVALGVGITNPGLGELAHACLRHLVDERPPLGQLPPWHPAGQELAQLLRGHPGTLPAHHRGQRPLPPLVVGHADDCGLGHVRVGHQGVLQFHGGDPLAAGLDYVLRPVGEPHEAEPVDGADVAGTQPAVPELGRVVILVVRPGHPGAAALDLAARLAVVRQHLAAVADQPRLHRAEDPALGIPVLDRKSTRL